ncbi:MAG: matrixin family metalloprotease, partial [Bdellovibrionales bacterium]|nr:matrixin family metalloprotease [Bdellovibrionales bacterium]
ILHFSISRDKRYFSLLLYRTVNGNKNLLAMYFGPSFSKEEIPLSDNSPYYYLQGRGIHFTWNQSEILDIQFCHKKGSQHSSYKYAQQAVDNWSQVLQGRLQIHLSATKSYPPFSDLQQKCIYIVPNYFYRPNKLVATYGVTYNLPDVAHASFFDSDVMILAKETQKIRDYLYHKIPQPNKAQINYVNKKITEQQPYIYTHELGHVLGLNHPFTDKKDSQVNSIMNYGDSSDITDYDIKAIQNLYPLLP